MRISSFLDGGAGFGCHAIDKHETETFKVIMKKNGTKMTLTPLFLETARR
jgi:hypothetical protein